MQIGSISSSYGSGPSQAMRDRMFKKADTDGDGSISLDEFKVLSSNKPKGQDPLSGTQTESTEDIFTSFDTDGDGKLSQTELDTGMEQRIQAFADKLKEAMFKQADTDGDGSLSEEEFSAIQAKGPHGPPPPPPPSSDDEDSDDSSTSSISSTTSSSTNSADALKALFESFDSDGDGSVSKSELETGLESQREQFMQAIQSYTSQAFAGAGSASSSQSFWA